MTNLRSKESDEVSTQNNLNWHTDQHEDGDGLCKDHNEKMDKCNFDGLKRTSSQAPQECDTCRLQFPIAVLQPFEGVEWVPEFGA